MDIWSELYPEKLTEAENKGEKIGKDTINRLNEVLIKLGRMDDLKRSVKDSAYQEQLISELLGEKVK